MGVSVTATHLHVEVDGDAEEHDDEDLLYGDSSSVGVQPDLQQLRVIIVVRQDSSGGLNDEGSSGSVRMVM